jgi:SAM-dependent MidA family methyltransferase
MNFTQLRNAGEETGLRTEAFVTQAEFLGGIMAAILSRQGEFGIGHRSVHDSSRP